MHYGELYDISSVTIFADYIVPAVLRELDILKYGSNLSCSIASVTDLFVYLFIQNLSAPC